MKYVYLGAAVAGLALAYMLYRTGGQVLGKAGELAGAAVDAVNPTNPDNIVNQGATAAVGAVIGAPNDGSWSIGTKIYDWTH